MRFISRSAVLLSIGTAPSPANTTSVSHWLSAYCAAWAIGCLGSSSSRHACRRSLSASSTGRDFAWRSARRLSASSPLASCSTAYSRPISSAASFATSGFDASASTNFRRARAQQPARVTPLRPAPPRRRTRHEPAPDRSRRSGLGPDVTRLVDRLARTGLAKRARTTQDRRIVLVSITRKGLALLDQLDQPMLELHKRQLRHMMRQELAELNRLLVKAREPGETL